MKRALLFAVIFFTAGLLSAQTPLSIGGNIGLNVPIGKFNDVYKSGVSGEVAVFYSTPAPGLDFTFTIGYNAYTYKNDFFLQQVSTNFPGYTSDFNADWKASDIPVMLGVRFHLPTPGLSPYVSGEIGVHMMKFSDRFKEISMNTSSSNPLHIELNNNTEDASETGFGFAIGAGVEFSVAPKIGLDLGLKYNYAGVVFSKKYTVVRKSNSSFTSEELKNAGYVTARGGLIIHL